MINHSAPRTQRSGGQDKCALTRKELSAALREQVPAIGRNKADKLASAAIARQQAGIHEVALTWALYEARTEGFSIHLRGFDPTGNDAVRRVMAGGAA